MTSTRLLYALTAALFSVFATGCTSCIPDPTLVDAGLGDGDGDFADGDILGDGDGDVGDGDGDVIGDGDGDTGDGDGDTGDGDGDPDANLVACEEFIAAVYELPCSQGIEPPPDSYCEDYATDDVDYVDYFACLSEGVYCSNGYPTVDNQWECESLLPDPECGNGLIEYDEDCDDGNTVDGDGCPASCRYEGSVEITNLAADPVGIPEGGGDVEICWSSTGAWECYLYISGEYNGEYNYVEPNGCSTFTLGDSFDAYAYLECYGDYGYDSEQLIIPAGPSIVSLDASPLNLPSSGGTTSVSWETYEVDSCTLYVGDTAGTTGTSHEGFEVSVTETTEVRLVCQAGGEVLERAIQVTVGPAILNFDLYLDAYYIEQGQEQAYLYAYWNTVNTSSCALTIEDANGTNEYGNLPPSSSIDAWVSIVDAITVTLTCSGGGQTVSQTRVVGLPVVNEFSTDPPGLIDPADVTVCWDVSFVDYCYLSYNGIGGFESFVDMPPMGCLDPIYFDGDVSLRLECGGPGGWVEDSIFLHVGPQISAFNADPVHMDGAGGLVTFSWDSVGMDSCTLSGGGLIVGSGTSSDGIEVDVAETTVFELVCERGGVVYREEQKITVGAGITNFAAVVQDSGYYPNPNGFAQVSVVWSSTNTTGCSVSLTAPSSQATYSNLSPSGQLAVPVQLDYDDEVTVSLTCSGGGLTDSATVVAGRPRIATFAANPVGLLAPGEVTLSWDVRFVTACNLYGPINNGYGGITVPPVGAVSVDIDATSEFALYCYNEAGGASVEGYLLVPMGPAIIDFTASPPYFDTGGGQTEISWLTFGMDACNLVLDGVNLAAGTSSEGTTVNVLETTTFELVCRKGGESFTEELTVTVGPRIEQFEAYNEYGYLWAYWSAVNASSCSITFEAGNQSQTINGLSPNQGVDAYLNVQPGTPVDVTLTCTDGVASVSETVTAYDYYYEGFPDGQPPPDGGPPPGP